ncbi:hypothetical protein [Pontibacter roseus]|uniref:hypothetical protein n=1 Tax=Pontibacter roseus TaxID=336989 RepID=UPI00037AC941|nr:hypothetical protein [Pontibacter roseus]
MKKDLKLNDIPKHNIYEVPDKYFDRLPTQIMERTAAAGPSPAPWFANLQRPLRLALAPLMVVLVLGVLYLVNFNKEPKQPELQLSAVADAEIVDYLSTYAVLESADFAELNSIKQQEMTAEFLNVSPKAAAEELEYYELNTLDY